MKRLIAELHKEMDEICKLDTVIAANLKELGYGS